MSWADQSVPVYAGSHGILLVFLLLVLLCGHDAKRSWNLQAQQVEVAVWVRRWRRRWRERGEATELDKTRMEPSPSPLSPLSRRRLSLPAAGGAGRYRHTPPMRPLLLLRLRGQDVR